VLAPPSPEMPTPTVGAVVAAVVAHCSDARAVRVLRQIAEVPCRGGGKEAQETRMC
jgi:hypothetical protein